MLQLVRPLLLMMVLACLTAGSQPALAARLASVKGEAGADEIREASTFKLGEQAELNISYHVAKTDAGCNVQVRLYRQLGGEWRVVNVVLTTKDTTRGSKKITLPAGDYKIEVVATDARFEVSVDN